MRLYVYLVISLLGLAACAVNDSVRWREIESSSDTAVFYNFISSYPKSQLNDIARAKIDSLDWVQATLANNTAEYESYYFKHPQGKHSNEAKRVLTNIVYNAIASETPGAYKLSWPENPILAEIYRQKVGDLKSAEQADYRSAVASANPDKCREFVSKWPGSSLVPEVERRRLNKLDKLHEAEWKRVQASRSIETYETFLKDHPDSKYHDLAVSEHEALVADRDRKLAEEAKLLAEAEAVKAKYREIEALEQNIIARIKSQGVGDRFVIDPLPGTPKGGNYCVSPYSIPMLVSFSAKYPSDALEMYASELSLTNPTQGSLTDVPAQNYNIHRYQGQVQFGTYTLIGDGDDLNMLTFIYLDNKYVYIRGIGRVINNVTQTVTILGR